MSADSTGEPGSEPELKRWRKPVEDVPLAERAGAARADEAVNAIAGGAQEPHARHAQSPLRADEKHDHLGHSPDHPEDRQEALIDEAVEESFPASDPPSAKRIT